MSDALFQTLLQGVLFIMVLMLIPSGYRLVRGPRIADRLLALDLITTILVGIMVLLALLDSQALLIDVALGLAALSFVATLAVARFVAEGSVF
ncbi:MAG: monovalent cation/H+ antiporter complex subunit F [Chloroflexota bacterium]